MRTAATTTELLLPPRWPPTVPMHRAYTSCGTFVHTLLSPVLAFLSVAPHLTTALMSASISLLHYYNYYSYHYYYYYRHQSSLLRSPF